MVNNNSNHYLQPAVWVWLMVGYSHMGIDSICILRLDIVDINRREKRAFPTFMRDGCERKVTLVRGMWQA